ncbi:UDP-glucose 4-epimerase family protein [Marinobacter adhaerens]|uniref:UDP-glucose 4-epimerase family protein n=1 Tax=Marinobacter adhaerens TaxID=1033846 RepID=UPI003F6F59E7
MKILISGANGFLGRRLCEHFLECSGIEVTGLVRRSIADQAIRYMVVSGLDRASDLSKAVSGQDVVIHAAARAHVAKESVSSAMEEYRKVNVEGTLNLGREAMKAGVKRFIFISSIGVNGSLNSKPFTESDAPAPTDLYARSKLEAEVALWDLTRDSNMELVVIRPPLVYGPNAPGNFGSLMRWVRNGVPLPFGAVKNKRSLVSVDNLVDLVATCVEHPAAGNELFLAGDGEDLSTTELLQHVAKAMGKSAYLVPVPARILILVATALGRKSMAQRLLGSLQVDISKARNLLGWQPPLSLEEGFKRCISGQ